MKSQDYTNRYLPDKHYRTEPDYKEWIKCYYCGSKVDEWVEHRGVLICLECEKE